MSIRVDWDSFWSCDAPAKGRALVLENFTRFTPINESSPESDLMDCLMRKDLTVAEKLEAVERYSVAVGGEVGDGY